MATARFDASGRASVRGHTQMSRFLIKYPKRPAHGQKTGGLLLRSDEPASRVVAPMAAGRGRARHHRAAELFARAMTSKRLR